MIGPPAIPDQRNNDLSGRDEIATTLVSSFAIRGHVAKLIAMAIDEHVPLVEVENRRLKSWTESSAHMAG